MNNSFYKSLSENQKMSVKFFQKWIRQFKDNDFTKCNLSWCKSKYTSNIKCMRASHLYVKNTIHVISALDKILFICLVTSLKDQNKVLEYLESKNFYIKKEILNEK